MEDEKREIPAAALQFGVGPFLLGDNGDNAKTAPFRMVARSGDSIDHWFWGKCVHDFSGMRLHKSKVAIDYIHDADQIIGYANKFEVDTGNLEATGALIPYKDSDRASEIIHKAAAGVPYEASINFGGDGIVIEEYTDESEPVLVNGRAFDAPVTIFREWPLRGIAVCPYGADMRTSTEFAQNKGPNIVARFTKKKVADKVEVKGGDVKSEELIGSYDETNPTDEAAPAVDAEGNNDKPAEETADAGSVEAGTEPEVATPDPELDEVKTESEGPEIASVLTRSGPEYLERFGDKGGVWFAEGREWESCVELHEKALTDEIERLRQRLATLDAGESEPVEFQAEQEKPIKNGLANRVRIQGKTY